MHMPIGVLLEPYSLDIQSSLIGRFGIIMGVNWLCTYRTKMISKDLMNISDLSTTLGISISIFTVGGFRDVSSKDFQDRFPQETLIFRST